MSLFTLGPVRLHSGDAATWKIDCDWLTGRDIAALAAMIHEIVPPFAEVEGVPLGGLRLATAMRSYASDGPLLIVDDVCTTGASLEEQRAGREAIGAVIFARGPAPDWVRALWTHWNVSPIRPRKSR